MNEMLEKRFFGTDGIRGEVGGSVMNSQFAMSLGIAIGRSFVAKGNKPLNAILGKDTRISGYLFESALQAGLLSVGVNVSVLGTAPTPVISYLVRNTEADFGIVISASHNPYFDNGVKIFDSAGHKISDEIQLSIESNLQAEHSVENSRKLGRLRRIENEFGKYEEFCERFIEGPKVCSNMTVVMDCANGATYKIAPRILEKTGASLVMLGVNPDGFNINENCGSTDTSALQKVVVAKKADIGIAFDGDGDRLMLVDHEGEIVDGDQIIFALALGKKKSGTIKGGVVGTHMSNLGLEIALAKRGIPFERAEVGDRYVMQALLESGWTLGAETSGHILNLDASHTGDAIVAALQVLELMHSMDMTLKEIVKGVEKFPQVLINVPVDNSRLWMQNLDLTEAVGNYQNQLGERGRIYIRASGTEPLVRVMVEGDDQTETSYIAEDLSRIIKDSV